MALLALDSNMYHMVVVLSEQNLSFGAQLELMTSYLNNEAKCTKKSNGKKGISKHTATGFFSRQKYMLHTFTRHFIIRNKIDFIYFRLSLMPQNTLTTAFESYLFFSVLL